MISLTITETVIRRYALEETPENRAIIEKLREDMLDAGKPQVQVFGLESSPRLSVPVVLDGQEKAISKEVSSYELTCRKHFNGGAFRETGFHGHVTRDSL